MAEDENDKSSGSGLKLSLADDDAPIEAAPEVVQPVEAAPIQVEEPQLTMAEEEPAPEQSAAETPAGEQSLPAGGESKDTTAETPAEAVPAEKKTKPVSINIKDPEVLYAAYMIFVDGGGLFIPTKKKFPIGKHLSLVLNLLDDPEKYSVDTKIVWTTPQGAQGNRAPGIGVQFLGDNSQKVRNKIEQLLAANLKSEKQTHTM